MKPILLEKVLDELEKSAKRLSRQMKTQVPVSSVGGDFDLRLTNLLSGLFDFPKLLLAGSSHPEEDKKAIRQRLETIDAECADCEPVRKGIATILASFDEA
jgi:hypothetical protein